jgi:hypothetical protein
MNCGFIFANSIPAEEVVPAWRSLPGSSVLRSSTSRKEVAE